MTYRQAITNSDGELLGFDYIYEGDEDSYADHYEGDHNFDFDDAPWFDTKDACIEKGMHYRDSEIDKHGVHKCEYCPGTWVSLEKMTWY